MLGASTCAWLGRSKLSLRLNGSRLTIKTILKSRPKGRLFNMVPEVGLEPTKPKAGDLQSPVIATTRFRHERRKPHAHGNCIFRLVSSTRKIWASSSFPLYFYYNTSLANLTSLGALWYSRFIPKLLLHWITWGNRTNLSDYSFGI